MAITDIAQATGNHDRLVITTQFIAIHTRRLDFQGPEVTTQVRTTKFVIERRRANGAFDHDIQCRRNTTGLAVGLFPGLFETGDIQVGHGETVQAGLGLGTTAGGALITDLAARAGGRTRMGSNSGGMVVGFHLH